MLTVWPVTDPTVLRESERMLRVRVAVAINALGGWAVIGWRGAAPAAMREEAQLLCDDPQGAVRVVEVDVPVISNAALAALLTREGDAG